MTDYIYRFTEDDEAIIKEAVENRTHAQTLMTSRPYSKKRTDREIHETGVRCELAVMRMLGREFSTVGTPGGDHGHDFIFRGLKCEVKGTKTPGWTLTIRGTDLSRIRWDVAILVSLDAAERVATILGGISAEDFIEYHKIMSLESDAPFAHVENKYLRDIIILLYKQPASGAEVASR